MQVPKRKTSKSRRNMRRSHHGLTAAHSASCPNCSEAVRPYHICPSCGYYRGKKLRQTAASE